MKDSDKELMLEASAYGCNNEALHHNYEFHDIYSDDHNQIFVKLLTKQVVVLDHCNFYQFNAESFPSLIGITSW